MLLTFKTCTAFTSCTFHYLYKLFDLITVQVSGIGCFSLDPVFH